MRIKSFTAEDIDAFADNFKYFSNKIQYLIFRDMVLKHHYSVNPHFYFQILGGHLYPFASEASPLLYENAWYFLETWTPDFTSRISIFAKLILIFRYLGGNLYPFASEPSPMLYENDWYFLRLEPPFLLPESLFLQS